MNRVAPVLLSLSLLTTAGACFAQVAPLPDGETTGSNLQGLPPNLGDEAGTLENSDSGVVDDDDVLQSSGADQDPLIDLGQRIKEVEATQREANTGLLGIPLPLLLAGGSGLIGLLGLILSITAILRVEKQRAAVAELNRRSQSLITRLGGVEVQLEQVLILNKNRAAEAERAAAITRSAPTPEAVTPTQPRRKIVSDTASPTSSETAVPSFSKSGLINALNSGDRQQLREAATAELNITSDSENAIATGRSITTELEVVPGGGSYWLVMLQGQAWLFPTERTLSGFAAAQPSKGLFHYEQQTIAKPQLLEPAALEGSEKRWSVKSMGRIGTP
jgi:hypothetical protein